LHVPSRWFVKIQSIIATRTGANRGAFAPGAAALKTRLAGRVKPPLRQRDNTEKVMPEQKFAQKSQKAYAIDSISA
jgi:hypothetical protein